MIVGLGGIAVDQYLPQIAQMSGVEIVAVCDVRADWAATQASRFGVHHVFTDVDKLIAFAQAESVDALVDLASIPAHFSVNLAALKAGLHVYSQKPLHGLTMITGILGPARAVSCLAGISEAVRTVRSGAFDGKEIHTGVPDNYLITLDFGNATFAVVDSSYCVKAANGPSMEIFGSKGSLSVGSPGGERAGGPPFEIYLDDAEHGVRGWMSPMTRLDRAKQAVGVEDLVGAIRDGREPVLTAAHARHVLEIMNACPVAARDGRT
ncbi:MAG: gfo/Idh/MocA family oxidoreductase, partial [Chloroflexi bacterium]|nr:gfo/Idh/MocA family oxidoreductase [Chloroflexota bacterium]